MPKRARNAYLEGGFGAVVCHVTDGIVRGTGALVSFANDPRRALIRPGVSSHFSFRKGTSSTRLPPILDGINGPAKANVLRCEMVCGCEPVE